MQQYCPTCRYDVPTDADRHQLLSDYYRKISSSGLPDAVGKMKQFACWFSHGVGNGGELRRTVHAARTSMEVLEAVARFFERSAAEEAAHPGDASGKDPAHGPHQHDCIEATFGT